MSHEPARTFLDSSVFINVFTQGENDPDPWLPISRSVLKAVEGGKIHACVSGLVVAEVFGCPNMRGSHVASQKRRHQLELAQNYFKQVDGAFD